MPSETLFLQKDLNERVFNFSPTAKSIKKVLKSNINGNTILISDSIYLKNYAKFKFSVRTLSTQPTHFGLKIDAKRTFDNYLEFNILSWSSLRPASKTQNATFSLSLKRFIESINSFNKSKYFESANEIITFFFIIKHLLVHRPHYQML